MPRFTPTQAEFDFESQYFLWVVLANMFGSGNVRMCVSGVCRKAPRQQPDIHDRRAVRSKLDRARDQQRRHRRVQPHRLHATAAKTPDPA